jgi:hypothetical protein
MTEEADRNTSRQGIITKVFPILGFLDGDSSRYP